MTDFQRLLTALCDAGVEFVIVGGLAATVHGSARLTQDVDVVYARSDENIGRLVAALAPFAPYLRGAPPGLPFQWTEQTLRNGLNFTLVTSVGDIDVLGAIAGVGDYTGVMRHTITIQLFGASMQCLDLRGLIHAKRAAGRPKDLETIAELELLEEEGNR